MENFKENEQYMKRALELAAKGMGYTSPNPMVGCVVVKNGRIISEGYHERFGGYHAERNALINCNEDTRGAILYVTLEPCCHYGKTPPCTEIIIEKGIKKVVIGAMDSNPLVAGKGVEQLKAAGIIVETGILENECKELNEVFFHYMESKMPFVAMKYAMTLDGKIACENGDSKWVTNDISREYVQQLRKRYTGIMVGIETVLKDDPLLTCRIEPRCSPVRIVCDSSLRIPINSRLVKTARETDTIVAYVENALDESHTPNKAGEIIEYDVQHKINTLEEAGVKLIACPDREGHVDLKELLKMLAAQGIDSILLEGGGILNSGMLKEHLVNRVYAFIAPKLVGGQNAKSPVSGYGVEYMADAYKLNEPSIIRFKEDIMITALME